MATVDLHDVQGNILRGYRGAFARHFLLGITELIGFRAWIREVIADGHAPSPKVSTAANWTNQPYLLNLAFTHDGLRKAGVNEPTLAAFPEAFRQGPANPDRAMAMGDFGPSSPGNWVFGSAGARSIHVIVSLYTLLHSEVTDLSHLLRQGFERAGLQELHFIEAAALPESRVHFGYRDDIAQPHIDGAPGERARDAQPDAATGDFLLGCDYRNSYGGNHLGDLPPRLGNNATFGAFRMLRQDVAAFESYIESAGKRWGLDAELVAAKLIGRWRNGVPLSLAPDLHSASVAEDRLNDFDYVPTIESPDRFDDSQGARCPIGAHIRRLNPRGSLAMGRPHSRRIVRRAMPFGSEWDGGANDMERGLVGWFLCANLEMQFEFIQQVWANQDIGTAGIRGTYDPLIGLQPQGGGRFTIPTGDGRDPIILEGLPQFVETRGSVYGFFPGVRGLHYLAELRND